MLEDVYLGMFVDGDVGNRVTPNYWTDDATGFMSVPGVATPWGSADVEFGYVYDADGDAGQSPGYCGVVLLDHTTDPTGTTAPVEPHWVTYAAFWGSVPFEDGGDPTSDFERYELMSQQVIEADATVPRDIRCMLAAGPFAQLAPGETLRFQVALFAGDRADNASEVLQNAAAARIIYDGVWLDLDGDPTTGVDGKEYQKHWVLPEEPPVPVFLSGFEARTGPASAILTWDVHADEPVEGYKLSRVDGDGRSVTLPSSRSLLPPEARTYTDAGVLPGRDYRYTLIAVLGDGTEQLSRTIDVSIPAAEATLDQNHPNPFNPTTTITFNLADNGRVVLSIFTPDGKLVTRLVDEVMEAGPKQVPWDGTDAAGKPVSSGVYLYRLETGKTDISKKMLLVK
jgi:hypothetical protein